MRRGTLVSTAAPARVRRFLERNPDAQPTQIASVLRLERSTVAMAITRLVQMKLYERPPPAPREIRPKQSSLSPTESLRVTRAEFSAATSIGPRLRLVSAPDVHPTGTKFSIVNGVIRAGLGAVQAFAIAGAQLGAAEVSRSGVAHTPTAGHPWVCGNHGKSR